MAEGDPLVYTDFLPEPLDPGGPTTVYRFYDTNQVLLYVGITHRNRQRIHQHTRTQTWWTDVHTATFVHYPTRTEAEDAEAAAILIENPLHNLAIPNPSRFRPTDPRPPRYRAFAGRPDLHDALARQIRRAPIEPDTLDELVEALNAGDLTPPDLAGHIAPNLLGLIMGARP